MTTDIRAALERLVRMHEAPRDEYEYYDAMTAARAALAAEEVGEGPILQWTENMPPSEDCRYDHCTAETPFGRFLISWKGWKQFDSPTVDETPWGDWYGAFNSVDAAKAACQKELDDRLARWGRPAAPAAPEVGRVAIPCHADIAVAMVLLGEGYLREHAPDRLRPAAPPAPEAQRDAVIAAVTEALGDAYDCLRVWEAWSVGTMGQDDFALVAEDSDRVAEIADAAIEAMRPAAPEAEVPTEALAARPLLEQVARLGDCIGATTVGQIMAISSRAAAWLEENPPGQPVAIEPRGCPTPGACSCVETAAPAAPEPGEVGELVDRLGWIAAQLGDIGWSDDSASVARAAALLQQAAPAPAVVPVAVSERLPKPNTKVLAHYFNSLGKGRTICAIWVPAKTRSDSDGEDDFTEYDEVTDKFYWPEGWYEVIGYWDDLGYAKVNEGEVVYWQPLPKWPAHAVSLPQAGEGEI